MTKWLLIGGVTLVVIGAAIVAAAAVGQLVALAIVGLALGALGVLLLVVGLTIYVLGPAFDPVRARQGYGSYLTVLGSTVLAVIVSYFLSGLFLLVSVIGHGGSPYSGNFTRVLRAETGSATFLLGSTLLTELSLLLVLSLRILRPGVITWKDMGLTRKDLGRRTAWGIAGGIGIIVLAAIVELLLRLAGIRQTQAESFRPLQEAPLALFIVFVLVGAVLAPVVEESFFRGYAFLALWQTKGVLPAFLFSALLFASVHLNLAALVPIFISALVFAYLFYRTRSIVPSIVAHGMNNLLAFLALRLMS